MLFRLWSEVSIHARWDSTHREAPPHHLSLILRVSDVAWLPIMVAASTQGQGIVSISDTTNGIVSATSASTVLTERMAMIGRLLAQGQAALIALQARYSARLSQLKSERAHAHDLAWELEDLEQRMLDLRAHATEDSAIALAQELTSILERRALLEEQALSHLLLLDELTIWCAADEQALAEQKRAWSTREIELIAEQSHLGGFLQVPLRERSTK